MNNKTDLLKRGMKYREKGAGFPAPSLFKILPKDLFAFGIDRRVQSHGVCMGGDTLVPSSIMVVTRNAAGDALQKNGKRSYVRTDGMVFMAVGQNWQHLG